ncbi:MAG: sulfatase-like hydrolase/transferase [Kiritimatiellae bacterium]|nr:sulfatase-like hydrolase/transferase [Kiritimatiellia bacterium]
MTQRPERPNLVYVFADQLRHDVFGFQGDQRAITPNFDRFAAQSVHFTNSVAVSPVCAAYRASLFTGKYTSSTGVVINECCINPNHHAIGYVLHEAGYNMGYLGNRNTCTTISPIRIRSVTWRETPSPNRSSHGCVRAWRRRWPTCPTPSCRCRPARAGWRPTTATPWSPAPRARSPDPTNGSGASGRM